MENLPMSITDFPEEVLQLVIIHLVKSSKGAEGLVRTVTVCKHFGKFVNDWDVLRVTNFDNVELSDVDVGLFQCNNSLIKRCAQLGNVSAQYLLAKVILATSSEVSNDRLYDYLEATGSEIDEPDLPASCFASSKAKQLSASSRSGGKLYHYELVRLFMKRCDVLDFASMFQCLAVYFFRFSLEAGRRSLFYSMGRMIFILGCFATAGLQEGRWCYDPKTNLLPTEFETEVISRLRNRCILLPNLSATDVWRSCKDMAEQFIIFEHGKENQEGVPDLGTSFFHYLVSKYFDEKVKLLDHDLLLSNSSFKLMKKLCVKLAKEFERHRSNAVRAFDVAFPSDDTDPIAFWP